MKLGGNEAQGCLPPSGLPQTDRQTYRHTGIQTYRQTYRHTDRHTDIQTYRHTDIQTYRQTVIQTDRQTPFGTFGTTVGVSSIDSRGSGTSLSSSFLVFLHFSNFLEIYKNTKILIYKDPQDLHRTPFKGFLRPSFVCDVP